MKSLTKKNLSTQAGFTLIELVVVIVILGILAATAAPKFIDLTGNARAATLQAVKASMYSARDMAHAKALVEGISDTSLSISGQLITFTKGWPNEASIGLLLDLEANGDLIVYSSTDGSYTHKQATSAPTCKVSYVDGAATTEVGPLINLVDDGC